jgi:signal peptidase II
MPTDESPPTPASSAHADSSRTAEPAPAASAETPIETRPIRRVLPWTLVWAASIILFDQGTKYWAEATLERGVGVPVIGDWIEWRLVYNPGAAFGIGGDYTWILAIIAAIAVVGISIFVARISSVPWALAGGAMLGGAISHLGDRLFREPGFGRGEIVDFIDYFGVFVGNVTDIALVSGAIAIVLLSLLGVSPRRPVRREQDPSLAAPSTGTH